MQFVAYDSPQLNRQNTALTFEIAQNKFLFKKIVSLFLSASSVSDT
jgi:hypothetical protein